MNEETGGQSSVGQRLIALREQKGLTLQDMVQRLRFSQHQLQLLEAGDYDALPDIMFVRALVRTYARQLGEPPEVLLTQLERERQDARLPHLTPPLAPSVPPKKQRSWNPEFSTFWKQVPRAFSMGVLLIMVILGVVGTVGWKIGTFPGKNLLEVVTVVHSPAPRSPFSNALPPLESAPVQAEPTQPLPAGNVSEQNRMLPLSGTPPVHPVPLQEPVAEKP